MRTKTERDAMATVSEINAVISAISKRADTLIATSRAGRVRARRTRRLLADYQQDEAEASAKAFAAIQQQITAVHAQLTSVARQAGAPPRSIPARAAGGRTLDAADPRRALSPPGTKAAPPLAEAISEALARRISQRWW
jgi:hypothetical protein